MSNVAIVTDSTAGLPRELIDKYHITILPLSIIWDERAYKEGIDIQPDEFYKRLAVSETLPTTSQVTTQEMQAAFEKLMAQGCDVLGIFLSSKFSGTFQSAVQARDLIHDGQKRVAVLDSRLTIMAMGWPVLTAARAAEAGEKLEACLKAAENARDHSGVLFVVETLEFLRRGGRIGGAQAWLGSILNIKPVLEMRDGQIETVEKVRAKNKALERVVELVTERIGGNTPVHLASAHAAAKDEADALLAAASSKLNPVEAYCGPLTPVIGTHAGPGTVSLSFMAGVK